MNTLIFTPTGLATPTTPTWPDQYSIVMRVKLILCKGSIGYKLSGKGSSTIACAQKFENRKMASEKSSAVNKALLKNLSDIVSAICASDPLKVGVALVSASLISQETLSKILTVPATPLANSTTLVMSVLDQVKIVPEKVRDFMDVLQKSINESSYQSKFLRLECGVGCILACQPLQKLEESGDRPIPDSSQWNAIRL